MSAATPNSSQVKTPDCVLEIQQGY